MSLAARAAGVVSGLMLRVWEPRERLGAVAWFERWISLRQTESEDYSGPYRSGLVRPMARLWELFLDHDEWRELLVEKSGQAACTAHALFAIVRRYAEGDGGNIIYAIHSAEEGRNIGRRLKALLEDCPLTAGVMEETPDDDLATLALRLPGCTIWIVGAGSAGALASKPAGLVIADEVDKHGELAGEAATVDLLRTRGKTVRVRKLAAFSTPTTEDGQIHREFLGGSQHLYHVPCPCCGAMQPLWLDRLRYGHCLDTTGGYDAERVRTEVRYECAACGEEFGEEHKASMIEAGEWRPTNWREDEEGRQVPGWEPGKLSARYTDLLAQWPGSGWGDIALEKIHAKGNPGKVHKLVNDRGGEPWKEGGGFDLAERHVLALRGEYGRGELPAWAEPVFWVLSADTQDAVWKWGLQAFTASGAQIVVDWGEEASWKAMLEIARDDPPKLGAPGPVHLLMVDEQGNRTREVRRLALPFQPWVQLYAGRGGAEMRHGLVLRDHNVDKEGLSQVKVWQVRSDDFARELYRERMLGGKNEAGEPRLSLPRNVSPDFVDELHAEELVRVAKAGYRHERWMWRKKTGRMNDYGDVLKMGLVAWAVGGHAVAAPERPGRTYELKRE